MEMVRRLTLSRQISADREVLVCKLPCIHTVYGNSLTREETIIFSRHYKIGSPYEFLRPFLCFLLGIYIDLFRQNKSLMVKRPEEKNLM